MLVGVMDQRFKAPLYLGDSYIVIGSRLNQEDDNDKEEWKMELWNPSKSTLYNSAILTVMSTKNNNDGDKIPSVLQSPSPPNGLLVQHSFVVYRDEWNGDHLSFYNVLNFFERLRSIQIGGPDKLKMLQNEERLLVVVARIDHGVVLPLPLPQAKRKRVVLVETTFVMKNRNRTCDCHQRLYHVNDDDKKQLVAQAVVTLMLLDTTTGRPAKQTPKWLVKRFT